MSYFDYAATYPLDTDIVKKVAEQYKDYYANPSSMHFPGKIARERLELERKTIAEVLHIESSKLYFTSGGSESNNLFYLSFLNKPSRGDIIISSCEHPSSSGPAAVLEKNGYNLIEIPLDKNGLIDLSELNNLITKQTKLVSVIGLSNETGAVQPLREIKKIITSHEKNHGIKIHFHSDCVQAPGKLAERSIYSIPDSFSLGGHKFGAPRGIGVLYCRKTIQSLFSGGGHENNIRPGTENLFGIMCFTRALQQRITPNYGKVLQLKQHLLDNFADYEKTLYLTDKDVFMSEIYIPNIVCLGFKGINGEIIVRELSESGFYCSAGSACSSRHRKISPCFKAMGITEKTADSFIRISLHEDHSTDDIDKLCKAIKKIVDTYSLS